MPCRDVKAVFVRVGGLFLVARLLQDRFVLLLSQVAEALIEKEREDVGHVRAGVDRAAQNLRGSPEMVFKLLLRHCGHWDLVNRSLQNQAWLRGGTLTYTLFIR